MGGGVKRLGRKSALFDRGFMPKNRKTLRLGGGIANPEINSY
jgi:hypothetical protein